MRDTPVRRFTLALIALSVLLSAGDLVSGLLAEHGSLAAYAPRADSLPLMPAAQAAGAKPEVVGVFISEGYWHPKRASAKFAQLAESGVNFVVDYALKGPEHEGWEDEFDEYFAAAQYYGIGVAFPIGQELHGASPETAPEYIANLMRLVRQIKPQRGISAWYVHDEVLPGVVDFDGTKHYSMTLDQMAALYGEIAAEDPNRPQLCVWNYLPTYEQFKRVVDKERYLAADRPPWFDDEVLYEQAMQRLVTETCDVVLVDTYPVGNPWLGDLQTPAEAVAELTARGTALKSATQPLYLVFQAFSWAQYFPEKNPNAPFPTRTEMRLMLCAAYENGASGAIGYSWFDTASPVPARCLAGCGQAHRDLIQVLRELASMGWPKPPYILPPHGEPVCEEPKQ